jgi:chromosome segregation protein
LEDVIFHGSKGHDASKCAEVTLTFDNHNKVLHYNDKTIAITRRLTRGDGSNEYFINGEPCRLRDIQEVFLDTGLSKGSLGIISQGTVQWFVEAKPEDRRTIFEEAAGIGLYTKKKDESNAQLARTTENLNRVNDIVNELSNDVKKLSKQAEKAKVYAEKRKELMHLDLSILVKDIKYFQDRLEKINSELKLAKNELDIFEPDIKQITQSLAFAKEKADVADRNIEVLVQELTSIIEEINKVELKKANINNQLQNDISSENIEKKAKAYRELMSTTKFELNDAKEKVVKIKDEIDAYNDTVEKLTSRRNELSELSSKHSIKLAETRIHIRNVQEAMDNKNRGEIGVRTILENKQTLSGIHGIVGNFLKVEPEYEKSISAALGKTVNNIIIEEAVDAQNAIDFLKQNQSGRATFLPLDTIKPRSIKPEHQEVLKTLGGYINTASNLISFDAKYASIFQFLLGNIIVAQDVISANTLSKYTYQMYRVITLGGDIIAPGGAITGGYNQTNPIMSINLETKLKELNSEFGELDQKLSTYRFDLEKVTVELNEITSKQNEKRIILSRYEESIKLNENEYSKYEMDYDQLVKKNGLTDKRDQ